MTKRIPQATDVLECLHDLLARLEAGERIPRDMMEECRRVHDQAERSWKQMGGTS